MGFLLRLFKKLKKSAFIKNILIIVSGTALAQALGFLLSPIISRLYTPADFGVFGSFNALLGIVGAAITLDYSQAIMLPKKREEAFSLFILSNLSVAVIGFLTLLFCLFFPSLIRNILKTGDRGIILLMIAGILLTGVNQTCQAWCVRIKRYKATSASQVIRSVTANGAQVALGSLHKGAPGLIVSSVLGEFVSTINLARAAFRDFRGLAGGVNWEHVRRAAKEYRDFPFYSASRNVIGSLSLGLPIFLLSHYYGIAIAGAYAFGIKVLRTPMELTLRALRQVLYQRASEAHNEGERLMPIYLKITMGLFGLTIIPAVIIILWAPGLFVFVFGGQWRLAGEFSQSLIIWLMFMFCNLPSLIFARILRMQRQLFFFDQVVLASRAAVLVAGGMYLRPQQTLMAFSVTGAILNIVLILIIGKALKKKEADISWKELLTDLKEG